MPTTAAVDDALEHDEADRHSILLGGTVHGLRLLWRHWSAGAVDSASFDDRSLISIALDAMRSSRRSSDASSWSEITGAPTVGVGAVQTDGSDELRDDLDLDLDHVLARPPREGVFLREKGRLTIVILVVRRRTAVSIVQ